MAQLAIKGHTTRGKKVIEILEMLGGKNKQGYNGKYNSLWYSIDVRSEIYVFKHKFDDRNFFTLEEFLEKLPYKVGDKVKDARINDIIGEIINARWDDSENQIIYLVEWDDETKSTLPYFARDLQPYKEETMEERKYSELRMSLDDDDKLAKEVTIGGNKMLSPNGYLIGKITQVDNGMLVEYVKQQTKYPKTYKECCLIMSGIDSARHLQYDTTPSYKIEEDLRDSLEILRKLIICRNAYWKIAGDWKPDWTDSNIKYCLKKIGNNIEKWSVTKISCILAFPTAEMRDTFKENFDGDIDVCKEFL